jgi:hypothetical protein
LEKIKPKGWLVEIIPSSEDKPSFKSLPNFLIPLHGYKKYVCFEIWLHKNRIILHILLEKKSC